METTVRRLSQGDESTLVDIVHSHKARSIGLEHCLMEAFVLADSDNLSAHDLYKSTGATRAEDLSAMFLYGSGAP
jgi:hypothetical protein